MTEKEKEEKFEEAVKMLPHIALDKKVMQHLLKGKRALVKLDEKCKEAGYIALFLKIDGLESEVDFEKYGKIKME